MINLLEKRPILTIIAMVGVVLLPFLDLLEVSIMEARNFITAREMLTDGNWILTTMNGEPRYEKPPLPTWIAASSAAVFGLKSVWGMRLPGVLMVMLLGSMIYTLSRKLELSKRHGLINGLVSVTSLYVVLIVFEAPSDIYTHAFMLTGIYFLFKYLTSQKIDTVNSRDMSWLWVALGIGASVLCKGPVSLYALFLPFLIAYIIIYRKETARNKFGWLALSLLLGMMIGFSWYGYVRYADPETFRRITAKETGNWTSYNVRPFYYYWSFFVQSGLWTIPAFASLLYPYMKSRVSSLKAYRFTLLWTVLAVVLLSIIPEKKSRYLMPVLIPLAMNAGFYLEYVMRQFKEMKDWREKIPVCVNFGLVAIAVILGCGYLVYDGGLDVSLVFVGTIGGLTIFWFLVQRDILKVLFSIFCTLGVLGLYSLTVTSVVAHSNELSIRMTDLPDDMLLYSLSDSPPEMVWEYGNKIPEIIRKDERIMEPKERSFLVLEFNIDGNSDRVVDVFTDHKVSFFAHLDINTVSQNNRNYKRRKAAKVYLVQKE